MRTASTNSATRGIAWRMDLAGALIGLATVATGGTAAMVDASSYPDPFTGAATGCVLALDVDVPGLPVNFGKA